MRTKKGLLVGLAVSSVLGNAVCGWRVACKAFPTRVAFIHPEPTYYAAERGHYLTNTPKLGGVVFAGDSTMAYPLIHMTRRYVEGGLPGPWGELFATGQIVNRAIPGDTIHGLHGRIGDVVVLAPAKVFVQVGVNDVGSSRTPDQLSAEYASLLQKIPAGAKLYVVGSLPTRRAADNELVRAINDAVRRATAVRAVYIDLWPVMADAGLLAERYTFDGIHLTHAGADAWADALLPYLTE